MKDKIIIEGVEYVKKQNDIIFEQYSWFDPSNVCMIWFDKEKSDLDCKEFLEAPLKKFNSRFKLFDENDLFVSYQTKKDEICSLLLSPSKTRLSLSYVEQFKQLVSLLYSEDCSEKIEFWLVYDEEKKEFVDNQPVILRYDSVFCLLAPRVME